MTHTLDITTTYTTGLLAVLTITGELDVLTSDALRSAAITVADNGHPHLILDLIGVPHCDSSGLSALIGIYRHLQGANGSLILAAPPDRMTRMLDLTGIDNLIATVPTTHQALIHHVHFSSEPASALPPAARQDREDGLIQQGRPDPP
ncbi:MAG: sle [Actinomycetia bacterium]|nr:sle [Actinomycetes bacterium]